MVRKSIIVLIAGYAFLGGGARAHARPPVVDLALELGGGALATDTAASGVKRFGMDLGVWADVRIPGLQAVAPQAAYEFVFLPGKSAVHRLGVGARLRVFRFFAKPPLSDDLVLSFDLGYVYAPTTTGDKNWFGYSVGLAYMVTRWSPVQFGPYLKFVHVVFKDARDPLFVTFGLSGSFALFEPGRKTASKPAVPSEPPEVMAQPKLEGRPGDRDGDGVGDASDLCPISAPGTRVDEQGCMMLKGKMVFPQVHFHKGSTRLTGEALLALKRLADAIAAQGKVAGISKVSVTVLAHAESQEPAGIAARRAERIRRALVAYGVPADQVEARAAPLQVVSLDRPMGPWWGRRVVFRFAIEFAKSPEAHQGDSGSGGGSGSGGDSGAAPSGDSGSASGS